MTRKEVMGALAALGRKPFAQLIVMETDEKVQIGHEEYMRQLAKPNSLWQVHYMACFFDDEVSEPMMDEWYAEEVRVQKLVKEYEATHKRPLPQWVHRL